MGLKPRQRRCATCRGEGVLKGKALQQVLAENKMEAEDHVGLTVTCPVCKGTGRSSG